MLRIFFLSLFIIFIAYQLRVYVDNFKVVKGREEMVNLLEGVTIKAYSKQGIEWTIKGKTLEVVGKDVRFFGVELTSEDAHIWAGEAYIDRFTGKGKLLGGIRLHSKDITAVAKEAYVDLKEGEFGGDGEITLTEGKNRVEGTGFQIKLRPVQVIISRARVIME